MSTPPAPGTREWNASVYHRVSTPQFAWGQVVLDRLPLRGDELVLDLGCGSGRLTVLLLERLPRGRAIGVDLSANMLATAARETSAEVRSRASFVHADVSVLPIAGRADAIFSTATFHWVKDHARLFRSLFRALKPGGRVVAQCGGGPNIKRHHDRAAALMREPDFAAFYGTWTDPWQYADAETTAQRLEAAGFVDIMTRVIPAPTVFPDRAAFVEFVTTVIFRHHLAPLPDEATRRAFVDALADRSAADPAPFEIDYWRLEFDATKPAR